MRSLKTILAVCALCLFAAQCNRSHTNIDGKWELQKVIINGSVVDKSVLQDSYWQFEDNSYTTLLLSSKDEGTYRIQDDSLFMKSKIIADRPETCYIIADTDSTKLELSSATNGNTTKMNFTRAAVQ